MSFQPDKVPDFLEQFEASREKIRNFNGCEHLELLQDREQKNVFFTYSYWKDEETLNAYRNSELFRSTWANTKELFNDRPQAWSLEMKAQL